MNYFETIAVISLFCLGVRAITDDGMIGYPIRQYFLTYHPGLGKPVVLCSTCMASVWGTLIFWAQYSYFNDCITVWSVAAWIGAVFSSAFINSVFWAYYESINMCKK